MSSLPILLLGATGYVGGTVLHRLLSSADSVLAKVQVTALVRGQERAEKLAATYGDRVACVLFRDYEETDLLADVASQHDVVVNAGSGFHPGSAEALVRGLAAGPDRGQPKWMIHTSGCSNISDRPLTGQAFPDREWDDADAARVYEFEKAENERTWYAQRAAELAALDAGRARGVHVVSLQAPCIYGPGEGLFQRAGLVIPIMMAYVVAHGYGFALGDGTAVIDRVHVADLADLYAACVREALATGGAALPSSLRGDGGGIVFPTAGRVLIRDVAQSCLDAAFAAGVLPRADTPPTKEIRTVDVAEAATTTAGDALVAEMGWAGHRATRGTVARARLGWRPRMGDEAWRRSFDVELAHAVAGQRAATIQSCIAAKPGRVLDSPAPPRDWSRPSDAAPPGRSASGGPRLGTRGTVETLVDGGLGASKALEQPS